MDGVDPAVARFVDTHLDSLDDLQVLIACCDDAERWWDARAIARMLAISDAAARTSLDRLARGNLLDIRITGDVRYRFRPGTAALEADASALAHAYRSNPMRIVRLVGASWSRAARDFADAFRFRRK